MHLFSPKHTSTLLQRLSTAITFIESLDFESEADAEV
jgi:hypothetical protein